MYNNRRDSRERNDDMKRRRYDDNESNNFSGGFSSNKGGFSSKGFGKSSGFSSKGSSKGFGKQTNSYGEEGQNLQSVNWEAENLQQIEKKFYQEHPNISNMSQEEVLAFRTEHSMNIIPGFGKAAACPNPVRTFEETNFPEYIMTEIKKQGFEKPSPIQCQGWPIALSGLDMIGIADTGSGKTISFLLPAMVHIKAQPRLSWGDGPVCLVLAPTRELVQQIEMEAKKFIGTSGLRTCSLVGGMPKGPQIRQMKSGSEIVVATPGRLIDLIDMGIFNLKRCSYFVLDEADRMLDMGFEKPLRQISSQIRKDRQTLLWSATWPKEVQKLANDLCNNEPVHITIGSQGLKANKRVTQFVEVLDKFQSSQKILRIKDLLTTKCSNEKKCIIFCKTKKGCDQLARELYQEGWGALAIHGDKEQRERDWVLDQFRQGTKPILIATDVAARGLDVKGVTLVVNYDFPLNTEDYVHRIGRTGRAGTYGESYTFFVKDDLPNAGKQARELIGILNEAEQQIDPLLEEISRSGGGKGKGKGGKRGGGYGGGQRWGGGGNSWGQQRW